MTDRPVNEDASPEEQARIESQMRAKFDALGLSPPQQFADEAGAPAVDEAGLFRVVCGELTDDQARPLLRLVFTYRSWYEAYLRIEQQYLGNDS